MTANAEGNLPAFPVSSNSCYYGMSLRDYFAVMANDEDIAYQCEIMRKQSNTTIWRWPDNWRSIARYMHADAMLEARGV